MQEGGHEMNREKVIRLIEDEISVCESVNQDYRTIDLSVLRDILALLKEQEPLKPKSKVRHGKNGQIQHFCRKCNAILFHHKQKFCIECGQAVKWE